jgi:hypothetical protein
MRANSTLPLSDDFNDELIDRLKSGEGGRTFLSEVDTSCVSSGMLTFEELTRGRELLFDRVFDNVPASSHSTTSAWR